MDEKAFLENSFFIYDEGSSNEKTPVDQHFLYFYPPNVSSTHKLFLLGSCLALSNFTQSFFVDLPEDSEPVYDERYNLEIITLCKCQLAFKCTGGLTMVLTGPKDTPTSALKQILGIIFLAYRFFYGCDHYSQYQHAERPILIEEMHSAFSEIVPTLLNDSHHLLAFSPLPTTPLARSAVSCFIDAQQILALLLEDSVNLGGCIFYRQTVLATQLSPEITRCLFIRLSYLRNSGIIDLDDHHRQSPHSDYSHVYIDTATLENHIKYNRGFWAESVQGEGSLIDGNQMVDVDLSLPNTAEFAKTGLYILSFHTLTFAIIMKSSALSNIRHIKKIRLQLANRLKRLEQNLSKGYQGHRLQQGALICPEVPVKCLHFQKDRAHLTAGGFLREGSMIDPDFAAASSSAHDIYCADDTISQVVWRDNNGGVYSRKVFEKEMFFHDAFNNLHHSHFFPSLENNLKDKFKNENSLYWML